MWCDGDEYVEVNKILYWFGALASPENHNHTAGTQKSRRKMEKLSEFQSTVIFWSVEGFGGGAE